MADEQWATIATMPDYAISDQGRVSGPGRYGRRVMRKPSRSKDGYLRINVRVAGKVMTKKIHHLVLEAFVGSRPDGLEGCHRNDDKDDNRLCNLYWGTRRDNYEDRKKNGKEGRRRKGVNHPRARLTEDEVMAIRRARLDGLTFKELGARFRTSAENTFRICAGKIWRHLPPN